MFYYEYILFMLPALVLGLWAQHRVKSSFNKYQKVNNRRGMTGSEAARMILDKNGLYDVAVEKTAGTLSDHYDPRANVIRLSEPVFGSPSVAAVGIAAHEAGHAVQRSAGYSFYRLRASILPVCGIGSGYLAPLLIFAGLFLNIFELYLAGIIAFCLVAVFQLVTLPVEFNASNRAVAALDGSGVLNAEELSGAKKVLSAAALTYVAALITSLMQIMYYLSRYKRK